jgi:hypothetical protein
VVADCRYEKSNFDKEAIAMGKQITLTPSQRKVTDELMKNIPTTSVLVLGCAAGMGRTTILEEIQASTGADLKAVVEDGKLLFAHAVAKGEPLRPVEDYFLKGVETVRSNRRNYKKRRPAPFGESTRIGFDSVATQSGVAKTPNSGAPFRV